MSTRGTVVEYQDDTLACVSEYFYPEGASGPLPVVLLCPAWDGLGDEIRGKAAKLAAAGFLAFAVDIHGEGKFYADFADLERVMTPFMTDRGMLLRRLMAALDAAKTIPGADINRIGVIGYCFGGTCALDMARSAGPDIRAAVSFHGGLTSNGLEATPISAPVLVLHGHDDPMVPPTVVAKFQQEMTERQADWQLVSYGHTMHGFTRPAANMPEAGVMYNARADARSWQAMLNFLCEVL